MESDKITMRVICNDERHLKEVIAWYNKNYGTDFTLVRMTEDEVSFADVEVSRFKPVDLFSLGYQLGVKEQTLRQKGQIDW